MITECEAAAELLIQAIVYLVVAPCVILLAIIAKILCWTVHYIVGPVLHSVKIQFFKSFRYMGICKGEVWNSYYLMNKIGPHYRLKCKCCSVPKPTLYAGEKVMIINTAEGVDFSCKAIKQIKEKLGSRLFTLDEIKDISDYMTSTAAPLLVLFCLDTRAEYDVDTACRRIHEPNDTKNVALIALHIKNEIVVTAAKDYLSSDSYNRFSLVVDWHKDQTKETDNNYSAKKLDQFIRGRLQY